MKMKTRNLSFPLSESNIPDSDGDRNNRYGSKNNPRAMGTGRGSAAEYRRAMEARKKNALPFKKESREMTQADIDQANSPAQKVLDRRAAVKRELEDSGRQYRRQ